MIIAVTLTSNAQPDLFVSHGDPQVVELIREVNNFVILHPVDIFTNGHIRL